jgi:hypothetical protein
MFYVGNPVVPEICTLKSSVCLMGNIVGLQNCTVLHGVTSYGGTSEASFTVSLSLVLWTCYEVKSED